MNERMPVVIAGHESLKSDVNCGVSQGGVFGPILVHPIYIWPDDHDRTQAWS